MSPPMPDPMAETCRSCGVVDRPTLMAGTGPHACKAVCAHGGTPSTPGFDLDISGLLDLLQIAHEALHEAKAALEEEVRP